MSGVPDLQLPNLEIKRLLGQGGMASVWLARQISLDREVAVSFGVTYESTGERDE